VTVFSRILVANRGEIAVRIIRTLRSMGIEAVAVYSDADRDALHVSMADEAVRLGPAEAAASYLAIDRVVEAARRTGAEAIHPGYGFLSENAAFAAACQDAGIVFIGPSAESIGSMGDKIEAKRVAVACGVPVVPGFSEAGADDDRLLAEASRVGLPLIVKPAAGGGGKGMRVVQSLPDLPAALASARREAVSSFGDGALLLERFVESARHVEVQVIADAHGTVVHAWDRDCSLQRRHQKVVEEAPAPGLPDAVRTAMLADAIAVARAVGYVGVGTVEFVVDAVRPPDHYFLEMNTRLQVEHPVTELVTGLDLVELQVRIAAGEPLPFAQDGIPLVGHAVEARVYAEDAARGFLPSSGRLVGYSVPDDVRVDSGCREGDDIGTSYDPLLLKVVAHGRDRESALDRLDGALAECVVLGLSTNIGVLRSLLGSADVRAGRVTTGLIASMGLGADGPPVPDEVLVAAALALDGGLAPDAPADAWAIADGWRVGERAPKTWSLSPDGGPSRRVEVLDRAGDRLVSIDGGAPLPSRLTASRARHLDHAVDVDGHAVRVGLVVDGDRVWVAREGATWSVDAAGEGWWDDAGTGAGSLDHVRSPMPGTVVAVEAQVGGAVVKGQVLAVVEAMKMEYAVVAPHDGVVVAVGARAGSSVAKDEILAEVSPTEASA
jgi:acetyl-CoA/propionyl-CoA carboxylase, biotin carboxylase, biotin carboxyl carrier protein